jgi:hypothetical protein
VLQESVPSFVLVWTLRDPNFNNLVLADERGKSQNTILA